MSLLRLLRPRRFRDIVRIAATSGIVFLSRAVSAQESTSTPPEDRPAAPPAPQTPAAPASAVPYVATRSADAQNESIEHTQFGELTEDSSATLDHCSTKFGKFSREGKPIHLNDTCDLELSWHKAFTVDGVIYTPDSVVIAVPGSPDPTFKQPLPAIGTSTTIRSGQWYTADRFKTGNAYYIYIQYKASATIRSQDGSAVPVTTEIPIEVWAFRVVKTPLALQLTGKVFTAWQLSKDGDQSYVVPGLAAGVAIRLAADYNDQDVLAIRLMIAAGPNLISKSSVRKDASGNITGIQNTQQFQILTGFEAVLGRFISAGLAWPILGGAPSSGPLLILTYGELYPAASTK